jgi:membrane protein
MNRIRQLLADVDRWLERHRWTRVGRRAVLAFLSHEALQCAGSMAYFAVLSVFQLLVLGVVVATYFVGEGRAREFVVEQVERGSPIDTETVTAVIDAIIEARGGIGVVGLIFLAWGALGLFSALNQGILRAFPQGAPRPFWEDKLIGLLLIGLTGLLALASIVIGLVTNLVVELAAVARIPFGEVAISLFGLLVPLALIFVAFLVIYRIVPNRAVTLAEVWPGAVVAALLWSLLRIGFTFYVTGIAKYDTAFGPISTGITLIVFLYFASVVILLGAEVARANVIDHELEARAAEQPELPETNAVAGGRLATDDRRRVPRWALVAAAAIAGVFLGRRSRGR